MNKNVDKIIKTAKKKSKDLKQKTILACKKIKQDNLNTFCFFRYSETKNIHKDYWVARDFETKKCALFNFFGEQITEFEYDLIEEETGLEGIYFCVCKNDKFGIIDSKGEFLIPLIYESIIIFNEGYAGVKKNNKYGFIDTKNRIAIPFIYDFAYDYSNGYYTVEQETKLYKIMKRKTGQLINLI